MHASFHIVLVSKNRPQKVFCFTWTLSEMWRNLIWNQPTFLTQQIKPPHSHLRFPKANLPIKQDKAPELRQYNHHQIYPLFLELKCICPHKLNPNWILINLLIYYQCFIIINIVLMIKKKVGKGLSCLFSCVFDYTDFCCILFSLRNMTCNHKEVSALMWW